MTKSIESLLQHIGIHSSPFAPNSRYHGIGLAEWKSPDGCSLRYVRRRLIAAPTQAEEQREYEVKGGDRMDTLASAATGDPERFWQIADLNPALPPEELTDQEGRILLIP